MPFNLLFDRNSSGTACQQYTSTEDLSSIFLKLPVSGSIQNSRNSFLKFIEWQK